MKKLLAATSTGITYLFVTASVFAAPGDSVNLNDPAGLSKNTAIKAENLPSFFINWIFIIGIVLAIIYLMYGGIKWITSGGDKSKVESARKHIIAAIAGLFVVAGTFFIISMIFGFLGAENPLSSGFKLPTLENPSLGGSTR